MKYVAQLCDYVKSVNKLTMNLSLMEDKLNWKWKSIWTEVI